MEKSKNFFENWAETQKTMLENWTEKTQEFQKNIMDGQIITKGNEMYQEWLKKQQDGIKSFTKTAEKTGEDATKKAANMFDNFFEQWKGVQEKTVEAWTEASNKMHHFFEMNQQKAGHNYATSVMDNARKYQESWMNAIQNMSGALKTPFDGQFNDFASKTVTEAYTSMQKGAENFKRMFDLWTPIFKAAQNNVFSVEEYKKLMNPIQYKELMDKMFGFDALNPLKQAYNQYVKTVSGWYEHLGDGAKQNFDSFKKNMEDFAANMPQSQEFFMDAFKNFSAQVKSSVSPFFKLMPEGKEKEQINLMNQLGEYYIASANKLSKLQYLVYTQGAKVNDQIMAEFGEKAQKGEMFEDFNHFYTHWVNVNGKAFENMFRTDEFSKLQGDLVTLDSQIRTTTDKLMEMALEPYPVVLKSQLDEIYKSNYDLKKQVYEMSKQIAGLMKAAATPVKAAAPKETAPKATATASKSNGIKK